MKTEILSQVYEYPLLSPRDRDTIIDAHQEIELKKGECIGKLGSVLNHYLILESGIVRASTYDYKGDEITTDFFCQHEVVIEVLSLFQRTPLKENLQAITPCRGWIMNYAKFQELFHQYSGFSEWGRNWMTEKLFQYKQKSLDMITLSAKERYINFIKNRPEIIQHVPLKHIATYLGITDTSLSRIRKEI